jgi:hypothetical protein
MNNNGFKFVKNATLGQIIGWWCFIFTAIVCILGMIPPKSLPPAVWQERLVFNIVGTCVIIGLGLVMPLIAKNQAKKVA